MSKAQRYKQQQKDAKQKAQQEKNPTPKVVAETKTLKERQAENKEALRKHQASMAKLKEFEAKLHPPPAGGSAASAQPKESSVSDMFYDGGNLNKDQSRVGHQAAQKESTPVLAPKPTPAQHEQPTPIS